MTAAYDLHAGLDSLMDALGIQREAPVPIAPRCQIGWADAQGRCSRNCALPAVAVIDTGCVHEHIYRDRRVCRSCLEFAREGRIGCTKCLIATKARLYVRVVAERELEDAS